MNGYEQRNIPLDTLVTDMDWHITFYKEANEGKKDQVKNLLVEKLLDSELVWLCRYSVCYFVLHRLDSRLAGQGSPGTTTSFLIPRDF